MSKYPTDIWHPCTQMKDVEKYPLLKIAKGKGIYLYDESGKSYIDAVSSWWVNLFGHSNPRLNEALKNQVEKLEHVIFAGCTHEPAEMLSKKLLELTPPKLSKIFFADNGSSAVESAMKMSYGYRKNMGQGSKNRYAFLDHGYHGETLGALSCCGDELYTSLYGDIMMDNLKIKGPDCFRCPFELNRESCNAECFSFCEKSLCENKERITAFLVEPLIQCAGGYKIYPPEYLNKLSELCKELDIHLIFDEIAVGFGRTGTMFALEQTEVIPDFLCLSKGITSGYLPLSVVLTNDQIYSSFYDEYETLKAFLHSHSYTGNPLACAVAVETLNIFEDENVLFNNINKFAFMNRTIKEIFDNFKYLGEIRNLGTINVVEFVSEKKSKSGFDWKERTGFQIYRKAVEKGAILRNIGDCMYFNTPYVITEEEITKLINIAYESAREVLL